MAQVLKSNQDASPWTKAITKALQNNAQLQFSGMASIAYVHQNVACVDICQFDSLRKVNDDSKEPSLLFPIDIRKTTFQEMQKNNIVEVAWYFPLTKEQFRIKCKLTCAVAGEAESSQQFTKLLQEAWERVEKENKKLFHDPHPDTFKESGQIQTDLDRFNSFDKKTLSSNFALLILQPFRMEQTSFAMPQVVADGRKEFESLFKPYKKHMKFLHVLSEDGIWKVQELNP